MDHPPLTVAVLMGGPSSEHEVSLRSGGGVADALTRRRWRVERVPISKAGTVAEASLFTRQALQQAHPDVVFIALHGTFGEDGTVQALCEELQLTYTGSTASVSRLGMDKVASRRSFESAGLHVPKGWAVDPADPGVLQQPFPYPIVVKPVAQGSSVGVSIVRRAADLPSALADAGRFGSPVLVEEFVQGREVTGAIVGEEPLPVIEIRTTHPFFDYTAKYSAGFTEYLVPAPLNASVTKLVQDAALRAHRAIGCRHLSRTDFILTNDNVPVVLEINTIPGFTPTSLVPKAAACAQMPYDELCEQLVLMAWHGTPHAARR